MTKTWKSLVMVIAIIVMALIGIPSTYEGLSHGPAFKFVVLDIVRPDTIFVLMIEAAYCAIVLGRHEEHVRTHGRILTLAVTWVALIAGFVFLMTLGGPVDLNAVLTALVVACVLAGMAQFLNADVIPHRPLPRGKMKRISEVIGHRVRQPS